MFRVFSIVESALLVLKMMHKSHVMAKIDALKGREDLMEVLQLTGEQPKKKTADPAAPEPGTSKEKSRG